MGKRSDFVRVERDYYPTPLKAVAPLIPHLPPKFTFWEPCAGDYRLVQHLKTLTDGAALCTKATDVEPRHWLVSEGDSLTASAPANVDFIITNPPWDRKILHPMINHFATSHPTWLLFDADWAHTKQCSSFINFCVRIVSVGRVKWIEGSTNTGKDNCAWYLFDKSYQGVTEFYGPDIQNLSDNSRGQPRLAVAA